MKRKLIVTQTKKPVRINDPKPAFSGNPLGCSFNFNNYSIVPKEQINNYEEGWPYSDSNPDERH